MFDVSFGELLLILIVGLLVLGPEKLPHAVRTGTLWINRLRRSFNQIRADIEREVGVDDIKRELHNQSILDSLRDVKKDLTDAQRQLDDLPYAVDQKVRENFQAEADAVRATIPADDFKHNASAPDMPDYDQQIRDIENSVRPPAPASDTDAQRS